MRSPNKFLVFVPAFLLSVAGAAAQQRMGSTSAPPPSTRTTPLEMENSLETVKPPAPAEEKAYKAFQSFQAISNNDAAKKTHSAEDFVKKFPSTQYTAFVYSYLMAAYVQSGNPDKGMEAGEKALQINPADYRTMAVLSQSYSRMANDGTPNQAADLAKAESYGKNALDGVPKMQKPEGVSEENFTKGKDKIMALAYSGLGLAAAHKHDFDGAASQLEKAIKLDDSDMTNFYVLGVVSQNTQHYDKAVAAFEKCAANPGNVQAPCAAGLEQAKKDAALHPTK